MMIKLNDIVRPNILGLEPYSSARDEFSGQKGVFLDANENPYGELNRYPDPHQRKLKKKLAELKGVDSKEIFIGNGSDEIIDLAFRIFSSPGMDKALSFSPTYGMYDVSAAINDVEILKIPLNKDFQIDMEATRPYLTKSNMKLIFICSPNNPTGNMMDKGDIDFIINNFNGIVILDEAYIDFAEKGSFLEAIHHYNNLVVMQTFSKAWGLASARIGVAYANQEIISLFQKVKPPYNVSRINQEAALKALDNYTIIEERLKLILSEKERLERAFRDIGLVKKIYPSEANFFFLQVTDASKVYAQLIDQKVITRNRDKLVKNCIRVTVGTPEENNDLLKALKNIR
jgi:histidinol-phosphate aminotransferase